MKMMGHSASPLFLIAILSILFFVGGVALELEASDHGWKKLSQLGQDGETFKVLLNFQNQRIERVHQEAAAAFDLAKISLGAVVALATQYFTLSRRDREAEAAQLNTQLNNNRSAP